jgi:hypothetical protein
MRLHSLSIKIGAVITTSLFKAPAPEPHRNDAAPHPVGGDTFYYYNLGIFILEPDRDAALTPRIF